MDPVLSPLLIIGGFILLCISLTFNYIYWSIERDEKRDRKTRLIAKTILEEHINKDHKKLRKTK